MLVHVALRLTTVLPLPYLRTLPGPDSTRASLTLDADLRLEGKGKCSGVGGWRGL